MSIDSSVWARSLSHSLSLTLTLCLSEPIRSYILTLVTVTQSQFYSSPQLPSPLPLAQSQSSSATFHFISYRRLRRALSLLAPRILFVRRSWWIKVCRLPFPPFSLRTAHSVQLNSITQVRGYCQQINLLTYISFKRSIRNAFT